MTAKLIGLVGKARSGKDTAASHLVKRYGLTQYAFADPLKTMLESVFGDRFRCDDRETPIWWLGKSPRELMQTLGTEWGRNCVHPDLWVLLAEQEFSLCKARGSAGLVISDVRFDNEAEMIIRQGGVLIEIYRPDAERVNQHISEKGISASIQRIMVGNTGTTADLFDLIDSVIAEVYPETVAADGN